MGYTTAFQGRIQIDPPLSAAEIDYLSRFSGTRRMDRALGPYHVDGQGFHGQAHEGDIRNYNSPPPCQPGLWCQWIPTEDGSALEWDGGEKFYSAPEWMAYLRTHFISLGASSILDPGSAPSCFTRHRMSGEIFAVGEDSTQDLYRLSVSDEGVFVEVGSWSDEAIDEFFGAYDEDEGYEHYPDLEELASALAFNPSLATFKAPVRIDDFANADLRDRFSSFLERSSLESSSSPPKLSGPGSRGAL